MDQTFFSPLSAQKQNLSHFIDVQIEVEQNEDGESSIAQWLALLVAGPAALGLIPGIPVIFSEEKMVNLFGGFLIAQIRTVAWN